MPLYEYECTACKRRFEMLQKFSDEPAKICKECRGKLIRLLSSPAIQFKGTGWYVTDYGKGSSGASTSKSAKANGGGEKEKAETTPAKESSSASTEKPAKS